MVAHETTTICNDFGLTFCDRVDTGDDTYNKATSEAITWQAGTDGSLMPDNQTKTEGNDDQVFWAFAAMSAAELKFPDPSGGNPSWAAIAQNVFNQQAGRWDPSSCGGGLRWQIYTWNNGYTYKNTPSNGGFFQLAARLARYTGNDTYVDWAEKMWTWMETAKLIDDTGGFFKVNDGADTPDNCASPNAAQFSYNYGILIGGLAYLHNYTQDDKWLTPLNGLLDTTWKYFFPRNEIMVESGCEPYNSCTTDGLTFKSFTLRWLALCAELVPDTASTIWPYIQASAAGAAGQCDGGDDGTQCGYHWTTTTYDGLTGVGQEMSALAAIQANMITVESLSGPLTLDTGATSKQNPAANADDNEHKITPLAPITTADKAGAWILTLIVIACVSAGTYWLIFIEVD